MESHNTVFPRRGAALGQVLRCFIPTHTPPPFTTLYHGKEHQWQGADGTTTLHHPIPRQGTPVAGIRWHHHPSPPYTKQGTPVAGIRWQGAVLENAT
ncbi:hypothetical protein Pcinc_037957 [Petrolisthes cinctipes]|uniref:Uncharacterized protein n=1 Tax=Petrolisthes cinctipes TaxID=88211 RepID=A0AAE1BVG1_PETCI|nr:hypothetical protein Pcinc_037957 [Petrolisthes cinctipes]